jgi:hypothetical protein
MIIFVMFINFASINILIAYQKQSAKVLLTLGKIFILRKGCVPMNGKEDYN